MFQDEAGFGRINKPKNCWCAKGIRPTVPCHHIREYRYAYGAIDPIEGESFFLIMPYCNTECMQTYLNELSKEFRNDILVLICDGAAWHKSGKLKVPDNIAILFRVRSASPPKNQAIADNRSIEQRICIKPVKRSRQRDLSLLVRFMQRRATPITQKDVSRR